MTEPTPSNASSSSRRDFLKTSTAATIGLGMLSNAHAAGSDTIKVGLIGCGGRGSGAAEDICKAAGTTYNIKLYAMGDVFEDHLKNCRERLRNDEYSKDKFDVADDRCFVGFDAYQKVIDCCDLVMLATPPGFRPQHIEATIKAGKQLFTEKPVAVDGTGIRKVLAAYEEANKKGLSVVAGTQRRHQAGYIESMKRIHDGCDRRPRRRAESTGIRATSGHTNGKPGWSDTEYQIRNWYHFLWLCGDHIVEQHVHNLDVACWALGGHPVRAVGMGGRQVITTEPERGQSYDHFAVDYEFPNGVHVYEHVPPDRGLRQQRLRDDRRHQGPVAQRRIPLHRPVQESRPRTTRSQSLRPGAHRPARKHRLAQAGQRAQAGGREHADGHHGPNVGLHRQGGDLGPGAQLEARHLPQDPGMGPDGRAAGPQAGRHRADLT